MAKLLHINSSARTTGSISRDLSTEFVRKFQAANPGTTVTERDLAASPLPHLDEVKLGAFFTPAESRTPEQQRLAKQSDDLVDELLAADVVVIGAPMYNFSVPSTLKAYIDHICRAGRTFQYTANGPVGLVPAGKKVYVFTSRGGVYSEGPGKAMDFHETYLRGVLGFIGITDVTFLHTEGLGSGGEKADAAVLATRKAIDRLTIA